MKNTLTKNGSVRVNSPCPFLKRCGDVKKSCPTRKNLLPTQFSCGIARLFQISEAKRLSAKSVEVFVPIAEQPVVQSNLPSLESAVQRKLQERGNIQLRVF